MKPLGNQLSTYGLGWPEVLRQFFWLALFFALGAALLNEVIHQVEVAALVAGVLWVGLLLLRLMTLARQPSIVVYENGVALRDRDGERSWLWHEITDMKGTRTSFSVNGILLLRYGANDFYKDEEKLFSVGIYRARANQLADLILLKLAQYRDLPHFLATYQEGQAIRYDQVVVNKIGLTNSKGTTRWDEIEQVDYKGDQLRVKRYTDTRLRKFAYVGPVPSYALLALLDRVRGTNLLERKQQEFTRSRGRIWFDQSKKVALVTLIVVPPLVFVIWLLQSAPSSPYTPPPIAQQPTSAAQFARQTITACSSRNYNTYIHAQSTIDSHKYLVIDANNDVRPQVYDDLQNKLPRLERATSTDDLTTVVCVWVQPYLEERCLYGDTRRGRYRQDYILSVIDMAQEAIIVEDYLLGEAPPSCPKALPDGDLYGKLPTAADFTDWLHTATDQPSSPI